MTLPIIMGLAACADYMQTGHTPHTVMQTTECATCDGYLLPENSAELSPEHRTVLRKLYDNSSSYTPYETQMLQHRLSQTSTDTHTGILHLQPAQNTQVPLNPYRIVIFCPNDRIVTEGTYSPEYSVKNKIDFAKRCSDR